MGEGRTKETNQGAQRLIMFTNHDTNEPTSSAAQIPRDLCLISQPRVLRLALAPMWEYYAHRIQAHSIDIRRDRRRWSRSSQHHHSIIPNTRRSSFESVKLFPATHAEQS